MDAKLNRLHHVPTADFYTLIYIGLEIVKCLLCIDSLQFPEI